MEGDEKNPVAIKVTKVEKIYLFFGRGNFTEALPVAEEARENWFGFTEVCERI